MSYNVHVTYKDGKTSSFNNCNFDPKSISKTFEKGYLDLSDGIRGTVISLTDVQKFTYEPTTTRSSTEILSVDETIRAMNAAGAVQKYKDTGALK